MSRILLHLRAIVSTLVLLFAPLAAMGGLASEQTGSADALVDEWIVGFHDLEEADVEDGQWQGHRVLGVNEAIGFAVVEVDNPVTFHARDRYRQNVDYVERDDPTQFHPLLSPDDPRYEEQYGFPQIGAPSAWDTTLGSAFVNVSVIDTGIAQDHEDLQDTIAAQRDFVEDDGTADDDCGHGTHVAGTVSANTDNGLGVAGTADGVNLIVAKALSNTLIVQCTGSSSDIADAITWSTDQGADVISMSFGASSESSAIGEAVAYAWDHGVLLVAAAGNDGECSDCVGYPAARSKVVAVTCTNRTQAQCSFSSQGPEAELAAPGNEILSTYDDGGYTRLSGTSMSAPHVSGVAALALSVDPSLSNTQLRSRLNQTAQDLGSEGRDNVYGHGEVDAYELVSSLDTTNEPPSAAFDAACTDLSCTFDASNSSDPDGSIATYDWTLGDGSTASGKVVDHAFEAEGAYEVNLTVTDDDGGSAQASTEVTVATPEDANAAPTAAFTFSCTELSCDFDASNSSDPEGSIQSYEWTFGDGATGNGPTPTHTYETGGAYTVNLTVTDEDGAAGTEEATVSVDDEPSALLAEDFDDGETGAFELTGLWHVSSACATAPSLPNYLGHNRDDSCTYDTGERTQGTATVEVDLSSTSEPELSFQHRWETESSSCGLISCAEFDVMRIQVSTDGGSSWTTLAEWTSQDENQASWTNETLDVSTYAGQPVLLRFSFDSRDDVSNDYEGWMVDDVVLTTGG